MNKHDNPKTILAILESYFSKNNTTIRVEALGSAIANLVSLTQIFEIADFVDIIKIKTKEKKVSYGTSEEVRHTKDT